MSIIHEALRKVARDRVIPSAGHNDREKPQISHREKAKSFSLPGKNLVGVDAGFSSVKIVRLEGGRGGYSLAGAGSEYIVHRKEKGGTSDALSALVGRLEVEKRLTASTFNCKSLIASQIKLPKMPERDLKEAVKWEVRKEIEFTDEAVIDYVINGELEEEGKKKFSIFAFAVRRDEIVEHMNLLKGASLKPYAIDVSPMALLSAFDYNYGWDHAKRYAVVNIGASKTTLAILFNKTLRLSRIISIAGNGITRALQEANRTAFHSAEEIKLRYMRGLDEPSRLFRDSVQAFCQDISREIHSSLIYYNAQYREGRVDGLLICGGCAGIEGLAGHIEETVSTPTAVYDPMRGIKLKKGLTKSIGKGHLSPAFVEALGLALRRKGR